MVAARFHPTFAQWYSTHIYPIFVSVIGRLSSMVSFSFVELSLYVMSLLIIGTGIHALAFRAIIPLQSRFSSLKFYPGRN